ncbi:MAG: DUF3501 family protein [Betaproteobacteria bacterium]|nr:MAG: DUF3501 family protein [Betaproteobacteria bacterium]
MPQITRDSLLPLEAYAKTRKFFREQVIAHKKARTVHLGEHVTLLFEDELTIRYQIQEMLRIEKTFEEEGIQDELQAYNPLVPDGGNWKATLLVEYEDVEERKRALEKLKGIEDRVWVQVDGFAPLYAIADEDLERENETKTSSVHFVRFELTPEMIAALKGGAAPSMGRSEIPNLLFPRVAGDLAHAKGLNLAAVLALHPADQREPALLEHSA